MRYKVFYILILLLASLLAIRQMPFVNYFNTHDNTTPSRQLEMHKCFLDKQFPCRWVPDFANGYGYPLFNYYPPLPYLVGEPFMILGMSQYDSVKISFFLSLFLSGIAMFLLGKNLFNNLAGLVSGIIFIWAPYRAVDIYVRGALNESWSFVFIPLILLFSYKIITENKKDFRIIFLAFSWAGLLLSHNVISLIFTPFFAIWVISFIYFSKSFRKIIPTFLGSILGLGIASFFTLPAFFERNLVWLDLTSGYFDYRDHFIYLYQLFLNHSWNYGFSFAGTGDGMSFQIGYLYYILATLAFIIALFKLKKSHGKADFTAFIAFILGFLAIFMTTNFSQLIWNAFPILSITQFPWRFLTIVISFFSLGCGYIVFIINKKWQYLLSILIIITITIFNWNYFLPDISNEFIPNGYWDSNLDYLPKTSPNGPQESKNGEIVSSQENLGIEASQEKSGTNWFEFKINTVNDIPLIVNILQFPKWNIYVDGQKINSYSDDTGRIQINVPSGKHYVFGELRNTPIRIFSNILSTISIGGSILLFIYSINKHKNNV